LKQQCKLKITIINILGEEVKMIYDGNAGAGKRNFSISEMFLKNGIYFLKADCDLFSDVKRIVCVK
jgi:hypothetical protein